MENIVVWGFAWAPPFAQGLVRDLRVRWALEEAGRDYEVRLVGFPDRMSDAHRRRHPFGMIPVVETGGDTVIESGAIVHAIAQDCPALMPPDRRTETLSWMFVALNTIEPTIQSLATIDLQNKDEEWARLRRPAAVEAVKGRLAVLAGRLEGHDYLLGQFTAADILMASVLRILRHTDLVSGVPVVGAYLKRCEARLAFRKALADQMNDYALHAPTAA
jgi:glutathione S-transferase